jgi:hypothetical protein
MLAMRSMGTPVSAPSARTEVPYCTRVTRSLTATSVQLSGISGTSSGSGTCHSVSSLKRAGSLSDRRARQSSVRRPENAWASTDWRRRRRLAGSFPTASRVRRSSADSSLTRATMRRCSSKGGSGSDTPERNAWKSRLRMFVVCDCHALKSPRS